MNNIGHWEQIDEHTVGEIGIMCMACHPRACSCETGRPLLSPPPPPRACSCETRPLKCDHPYHPPPPPYSALQFEEQINCKWVVEMLLSIGYDKERNTNEQTIITILANRHYCCTLPSILKTSVILFLQGGGGGGGVMILLHIEFMKAIHDKVSLYSLS